MPVHANDDQEIAQATPRKRQRMSLDLRRQIVALRDEDLCTFREITDYLDVPVATAHNVCTKFRETGIIEPRASKPPNRTVVTREMEEFLAEEIDKDCAVTNGMLADKLHEKFDVKVNATTIGRHVKRMGIDFKMIYEQVTRKNSMAVKMKRQEWFQDLANANIPQSRIFYVDECGFNINMHRSRGRAPKGKRAIKNVDSIRAPNWTLICVIGDTGVVHYDIHHGPVNQHVFQRTMAKFIHVLEGRELEPHTAGDSFRDDEDHGTSDDEHDSDQAPEQELEDEGSAKYVEFHGKVLSAEEPSQSEHNNSNHTHHHHNHNNNSSSSAPAPSSSSAPAPPSTGAGTSMQHAGPSAQHAGTLTQHAAASSTSNRAAAGVSLHAQQRTQPRDTHAASELLRRRRGRLPRGHHRSTAFTDDIQDEDNSADDVGQWSSAAAAASHPASSTGTSSLRHPMRTRRLQQLVQPSSQTSARAAAPRRTSTYTYPPAVEALWTNDADDDDDDDDDDDEEAYHPSQAECFQDEAEEGNDNADLLIASEEKYGRSFPRDGRTYKAWIVMDNASFHKTASLRNYFWRRNYRLLYLPPYSSFLNPIEYVFGKIKSCFKRTPLKKGEKVHRRIEDAVRQVSAQNCSRSIVHVSKYAFPCAQLEDIKD